MNLEKIAILFMLLIVSSSITAQSKKSTTFGIKGGYNKSTVNGTELDGTKTGYIGYELYGSLFSDTELNNEWNFENELLFSYTDNYHFIEIPVHFKRRFLKKCFILLGPKLDFIADNDNDSFERYYRFRNFGVSGELGIQYNISKRFFVETRYSKSFTSQIDDLVLEIYSGKRNTFRIGVGIKF
ncbi:outer membrane beta-barrel protein [Flavobacterium sp.]|uniref:outer membrane beta-barrel protein n=1 Tax=Flavobacterium sp. TaxID=239 RepID=UPI00375140F9